MCIDIWLNYIDIIYFFYKYILYVKYISECERRIFVFSAEIEKGTDVTIQRPYFDDDNCSSSDGESELEFVRPDDRDYEEKVPIVSQN